MSDKDNIDIVEETKLLGVIIRSDLKTVLNTDYIVKKAYKRMWMLRRLKHLGAETSELLDVLRQQVISVCELTVPYWGPNITVSESIQIERVLRTGLYIVYGDKFKNYEWVLIESNMEPLMERRQKLMERFSQKCYKSKKFNHWFEPSTPKRIMTRRERLPLKPVQTRTIRYRKSSLPKIVEIMNNRLIH